MHLERSAFWNKTDYSSPILWKAQHDMVPIYLRVLLDETLES